MENLSFLPFLLIIISVLAGIGGITLLIIGLIQSKRCLWLPGTIIFSISFFIGIIGIFISIRSIFTNISENIVNFKNINKHLNYIYSDSLSNTDRPVDSTFSEPISGFIEDSDNSLIFIKVFPEKDLLTYGISLEKVSKGLKSQGQDNNKSISLLLNFNKNYSGRIKLTIFDYEKNILGLSSADVNKKQGEIGSVNFSFSEDVNFSIIDYCTFTFE